MQSVFTDKNSEPYKAGLKAALGSTFTLWEKIRNYVKEIDHEANEGWHFSGEKFGWSFRISDRKRVLVYLLPRNKFFKVAFVFGEKAAKEIMNSGISATIRRELSASKAYAEGRGIRLEIRDPEILGDIRQLIGIKASK